MNHLQALNYLLEEADCDSDEMNEHANPFCDFAAKIYKKRSDWRNADVKRGDPLTYEEIAAFLGRVESTWSTLMSKIDFVINRICLK